MKVLMISGDRNLLKEGTEAYARLLLQRSAVEQLDVFVWPSVHSYAQIAHAARENRYDVVTAQDPFWRGLLAWRIARRTGARLNVQLHADFSAQSLVKHVLGQIVIRHADSVRVVSQKGAESVERIAPGMRVSVLPVFIDVERFRRVVREPHMRKTILWVGRFEPEKDPLRAISVLSEVRARGADATLIMLGSGSLERMLRKAAQGRPVEFPGWQDSVPYLARADVVLSTSPSESFGASIIEALAAGVPTVSLDVGIAREAGAHIARPDLLAEEVTRVLAPGARGELRIELLSKEEWVRVWKESL